MFCPAESCLWAGVREWRLGCGCRLPLSGMFLVELPAQPAVVSSSGLCMAHHCLTWVSLDCLWLLSLYVAWGYVEATSWQESLAVRSFHEALQPQNTVRSRA